MNSETQVNIITGYHLDQFQIGMFEYINHDHLTFLTVHDFKNLCDRNELRINYVRRHEHKGGSIEIGIVRSDSAASEEESVGQILQREVWMRHDSNDLIYTMLANIERNRNVIRELLSTFYSKGYCISGIGASISSTALLYSFDIGKYFDSLYDDDPRKIGKFSPGFGIQVLDLAETNLDMNTINVILSWQHTDRLLSRLREVGRFGLVIIPMPSARLIFLDA